jgi:hypothetical protein
MQLIMDKIRLSMTSTIKGKTTQPREHIIMEEGVPLLMFSLLTQHSLWVIQKNFFS